MKIGRSLIVFTDDGILIYAPLCAGGGGVSCSLYNSNHTNYIDIHTRSIVGLQVRALFP